MLRELTTKTLTIAGALTLGFGVVMFSPTTAQAEEPTYRHAETLSTQQKLSRSSKELERMKSTVKQTLERLKAAREKQDIIQVNCVDDKLQAIQALLNISEDADRGMREAAAREDVEMINHEFTKISFTATRVENFRVEVEGCMGEASQYTGKTVLDVTVSNDIRSDDPADADAEPVFTPVTVELDRPEPISGSE